MSKVNKVKNLKQRVLVTGGAGFIGSYLIGFLLQDDYIIRVMDLPGVDLSHLPLDRIEFIEGDVTQYYAVLEAMAGCEYVVHLAANPNLWDKDPKVFHEVNYQGTLNLLAAAKKYKIKKFIHVSTESILLSKTNKKQQKADYKVSEATTTKLSDMPGAYCKSKWQAENAALNYQKDGLPVIIVSPTVPVGPDDYKLGPFSRLVIDVANRKVKGYLDGVINIIDVRDVALGICITLKHGVVGEKYILGGENWKIKDLLDHISTELNVPKPRFKVPYLLALGFAWCEEIFCKIFNKTPMATVAGIKLAKNSTTFDASISIRRLDLKLSQCEDSIKDAVKWMRQQNLI